MKPGAWTLRVGLVAGLVLATMLPAGAQNADEFFKDGLDAFKDRRWVEVITAMQRAIQSDATESSRKVRSGLMIFRGGTEYVPFYFLGAAHFQRGDCAAALDAWSRSERQRVVTGIGEFTKFIQESSKTCEAKGFLASSRFDSALGTATQQIADATGALTATNTRIAPAGELFNAERRRAHDDAAALIKEAQGHLDAGRRTRLAAEFAEVATTARRATVALVALADNLDAAMAGRSAVANELASLNQLFDDATGLERVIETRKAYLTDALAAARQQALQAVGRARRIADGVRPLAAGASSTAAIADARREISGAVRALQQIVDDTTAIERKANESRNALELRLAREKFGLVDRAFKTFDQRAAARPEQDPKLASERQTIERRMREARRQLDAANKAGDAAGIQAARRLAEQLGGQLDELIRTFGPLTILDRGVHPALAQGATHFFNGDFALALETLTPPQGFPQDMPFLEHVHLFRAAALHAMYLKGGSADASLRDRARVEIAALADLDGNFQPDVRAFSPRFLSFVRETTTPRAAAAPAGSP